MRFGKRPIRSGGEAITWEAGLNIDSLFGKTDLGCLASIVPFFLDLIGVAKIRVIYSAPILMSEQ